MNILLLALMLLSLAASSLLALALLPKSIVYNRLANSIGAFSVSIACLLALTYLIINFFSGTMEHSLPWGLPYGSGAISIDNISKFFLFPVFCIGGICGIISFINMRSYYTDSYNIAAHWFFYISLLLGMTFIVVAKDAVLFIFAWELMSVAAFFLINFYNKKPKVREAAWIFLIASHFSLICVFVLFALLWSASGHTNFAYFAIVPTTSLASIIFIVAIIGFGIKAAIVPLHIWLPVAHPIAPSHISAILSSVVINMGLYGLIRTFTFFDPLQDIPLWWGWLLLGIGLLSGIVGILKAMTQDDLKCLLAYSSAENMGIMFMGIGIGLIGISMHNYYIAILGFTATIFHMLNHSIFKGLLFLCAGVISSATKTVHLNALGGLQKTMPLLGIFFLLGVVAIICLPPLNGFSSEFLLYFSLIASLDSLAVESRLAFFGVIAALSLISALSLATFAKAYGLAFLGTPRSLEASKPIAYAGTINYVLGILGFLCLVMGLSSPWIFKQIVASLVSSKYFTLDQTANFNININEMEMILYNIVVIGIAFVILGCIFVLWRKVLNKNNGLRTASTWSCGFQAATSRIQYKNASFIEPSTSFFSKFSGVKTEFCMSKEYFPAKGSFSYEVPHRFLKYFIIPCFEYIVAVCNKLKIIQHGRIHLYILCMFGTLLSLLVWTLWI